MEGFEEQFPDVPDVSDDDRETAENKLRGYVLQLQELIAVTEGSPTTNIFDRCLGTLLYSQRPSVRSSEGAAFSMSSQQATASVIGTEQLAPA